MAKGSSIGRRRTAAKQDSSELYQARRREIAEAAVRVFNRLGFEGASVAAVADELKIDRASLYYYISSKEELFDELVRTVVERNLALTKRIAASDASPSRKLRDLIIALMSSYGEHYPLFYIYIRENLSHVSDKRTEWARHMRKINAEAVEAVVDIVKQGYEDKSFRNLGSARVVAYGILGIIGWTHRWFQPGKIEVTAAEIGTIYADLILSGIEAG